MSKVSPHPGSRFGALFAGGLILLAWPSAGLAKAAPPPAAAGDQTASALRARIGPPHDETLKAYVEAGAKDAKAHVLTDREWTLIESAIADLPVFYRQVLERRLARLSFIDAPSSTGTALTRASEGPNGELMFDITIRAEVLDKSLSEFLTQKEAMLFSPDGSGYSVKVTAGQASALTYILLHETTHVIDRALDITMAGGPFKTVWVDYRGLAPPYAQGAIAHSVYRREPKLPLSQSPTLYRALAGAPFVSLYATASAGEDFAELLAWRELSSRFGTPLKFQVLDGRGVEVVSVEPLKSAAVRSRFEAAQAALANARAASPDKL
ncbi:hypothetical protein [Caulobacter sp. 602-1]|uniref:hypothetical protein n=1 Tax=Caulobacter sp. 602-1 TaxID=2492472 RepID=UPI000F62E234|nr:hypothetical protein [Caulobacter sp. 602-1]RRN64371.1 hypothetical protein EIK80_09950 [Caulobacter sp. 602-1]